VPHAPLAWHVRDGLPPYGGTHTPELVENALVAGYVATPVTVPVTAGHTLTAPPGPGEHTGVLVRQRHRPTY
jgi:hypothetical protein